MKKTFEVTFGPLPILKSDSAFDLSEGVVTQDTSPTSGIKHDTGKPMFHCLDAQALLSLGAVAEYGARLYGDENWRQVHNGHLRYFDAAIRHLLASRTEMCDTESGQPHLAHAAWNCLACLALTKGDPHA